MKWGRGALLMNSCARKGYSFSLVMSKIIYTSPQCVKLNLRGKQMDVDDIGSDFLDLKRERGI